MREDVRSIVEAAEREGLMLATEAGRFTPLEVRSMQARGYRWGPDVFSLVKPLPAEAAPVERMWSSFERKDVVE